MDVLKNLNEEEVTALRERFAEPLPQAEFEQVLTEFTARMPHIDVQKLRLTELFNDIDANGDMTVSWDEFTMFLIDAAALEATLATSGRDAVIKQYRPLATLDNEVPGSVAAMRYIPALNRVVKVIQREKYSKIRLCMPTPALPVWMEAPRSNATILAYDYIPPKSSINVSNVLACATNDNVVRFLDVSRHMMSTSSLIKPRKALPVPEAQTALHWAHEHNKLLMGSRSGVISVVNPDENVPVNTERIHESVMTSILSGGGVMYTGSLDSTVKLTDLNRGVVKHTIDGPNSHAQGVFLLSMSQNNQQLFSAGLEAYVLVHSLSNSKMKPQKLFDKNRPHHGRIVSLEVLNDSPQVITADSSGLVKIWDSRTLSCVQTISTVKDDVFNVAAAGGANLSSVGYIEKNKMLCINGRTTKVFGYDTASNPHLSDDNGCTLVVFNPISRTFMSVHRTTIKLWDGQTGALRGVHTNVVDSEITALTIAVPRMRKIIVGTLSGELHAFGYAMCTPIGEGFPTAYTSPTASVVALWYLDGFKENRGQYVLTVYKREVALVPDADENASRSVITLHCFHDVLKEHQAKALSVTENKTVLVATEASTIYVCDLGNFTLAAVVRPTGLVGDICSMTAFPDTLSPFVAEGRDAAGHVDLNDSFAMSPNSKPGTRGSLAAGGGGVDRSPGLTTGATSTRRRSLLTNLEEARAGVGSPPGTATSASDGGTGGRDLRRGKFYRRLGTGVAFVADSVGNIAAVLMHSAQAMETIVTWRNLNADKRKKKRRHRRKDGPDGNVGAASTVRHRRAEDDEGDLIQTTSDGVVLAPAMSFAVGDVAHMVETEASFNPSSGTQSLGVSNTTAQPGKTRHNPLAADDDEDAEAGSSDDDTESDAESGNSSHDEATASGTSSSPASSPGASHKQENKKRHSQRKRRAPADDEPVDVKQVLGSRPNSAVAAYFDERMATAPDGTGRRRVVKTEYSPVVTAMCFLADGHVLVTGDENGYVTTWDVDLIVRKAARAAAKRDYDGPEFAAPQPTPIASWRAHSDEVVSVCESFGERTAGSNIGQTGAVVATASIDRNVFLWTTDGVALGNLAQGRIPDDNNELIEGIKPFTLDDPPKEAWAITDRVRRQREVVASLADAARDARAALHVALPGSPKSPSKPIIGFGLTSPTAPAGPSVGQRLAAKADRARESVNQQHRSGSQSPERLRSPVAAAPGSPPAKPHALEANRSESPLTPVVASGGGGGGGEGAFFVTEVAGMETVVKGFPSPRAAGSPTVGFHGAPEVSQPIVDDDATSLSGPAAGPYVPKELRGIVSGERFRLPEIGKGKPPRRLGGKALRDSASARRPSLASLTPRQTAAQLRKEAEETVAQTARAQASSAPASTGAGGPQQPQRTRHGTKIPTAPAAAKDGSTIGKHLSAATQRYLHTLGFDDNPQENPEQKSLRHHGTVVIKRPVAPTDGMPSRRVL